MSGPESVVRLVTAAEARVVIQPSGIDVDQTVDLVAVDVRGEVMGPVDIEPSSVHVQIAVGSGCNRRACRSTRSSPGRRRPASRSASVTVTPAIVSRRGRRRCPRRPRQGGHRDRSRSAARRPTSTRTVAARPARRGRLADRIDRRRDRSRSSRSPATRTYSSGIVLSGARDDRTYTLSTDSVLVTVGGTVASLDALDPRSLAVVADVDGLAPGVAQGQAEDLAAGRRQAGRR